jgi:hypothetical protein
LIWGHLIFTLIHFSSSHPYKLKTESPQSNYLSKFISDLGPLPETSMKVEKKSELIGRGGGSIVALWLGQTLDNPKARWLAMIGVFSSIAGGEG